MAWALAGCETYQLRGLVTYGSTPGIQVLDKNDERLSLPGVQGATIDLVLDPNEMRPQYLPAVATNADGHFTAPIKATGAGLLLYKVQIVATRDGYRNVWETIDLPGGDKRVLITMTPGPSGPRPQGDIVDETLRIGEELQRQ